MMIAYDNEEMNDWMLRGEFGLERESVRVDADGYLAATSHPWHNHPHIARDFSESQVELITDVYDSVGEVCQALEKLHLKVLDGLPEGEVMWSFSNPPYVRSEADIMIAHYEGALKDKEIYRRYLADKYGKYRMLYCGIHVNFSFPNELLRMGYEESLRWGVITADTFQEYKNKLYLSLSGYIMEYSWLLVYLTAASPVADESFAHGRQSDRLGETVVTKYASCRCGEKGYWNTFAPVLDYSSLPAYVASIARYITDGMLYSPSELYYPVRLKPRGDNSLKELLANGVNHIELRMMDVNPLSPIGVLPQDLSFVQLLLVYFSSLPYGAWDEAAQRRAIANEKAAARLKESEIWIAKADGRRVAVRRAALELLDKVELFFVEHDKLEVLPIVQYQKDKILNADMRYADRIVKAYGTDYVKRGLELSREHAARLLEGRAKYSE